MDRRQRRLRARVVVQRRRLVGTSEDGERHGELRGDPPAVLRARVPVQDRLAAPPEVDDGFMESHEHAVLEGGEQRLGPRALGIAPALAVERHRAEPECDLPAGRELVGAGVMEPSALLRCQSAVGRLERRIFARAVGRDVARREHTTVAGWDCGGFDAGASSGRLRVGRPRESRLARRVA